MILGADGKPVRLPEAIPTIPSFVVTRQLKRAYLRVAAMTVVNQKAGGESRKLRRSMALTLAKRPQFVEEVRQATHAW